MKTIEIDVRHIKESMSSMKEEIINAVKDQTVSESVQNESMPTSSQATTSVNSGGSHNDNGPIPILDSIQDRMNRKNNVVFYNVAEGKGNLKDEKVKHDMTEVKSIAAEVGLELADDDIVSVRRLGKTGIVKKVHGKEVEVPRVLLVGFTETIKATVMKNAYKLQYSKSDYLKKVGIKHDMNKEERQKDAELRQEAKKQQNESGDVNFRFVVRGPTWDRKIVKVRASQKTHQNTAGPDLSPAQM